MADLPQSYANHRRLIPLYHGAVFIPLTVNLGWGIARLARFPSPDNLVAMLTAAALILLFFYARAFALTVQDRVIRLEERLRLRELLPADLQPRIGELSPGQLVALRFAGDGELPALARKVLDEGIADRDAIKRLIRDWRADRLRV